MGRRTAVLVMGLLGLMLGLAAQMVYADGGDSSLIHACVKNNPNGGVRIIGPAGSCGNNETAVHWSIAGLPGDVFAFTCPPDSVRSGTACIDKYEASVWETTNAALIATIKAGTATLVDLTVGATQRGVASDDYDPGCPDTGNGCKDFYAVSILGVTPSRFITWFQAAAAARNSGKRLPTNQEWQAAALGTPDPGTDIGTTDCNISSTTFLLPEDPVSTGSRSNCVSDVGASDMVGNLWEWVADWVPPASGSCGSALFGGDLNCLAGASTTAGTAALIRGGDFFSHFGFPGIAGVFAVRGNTPSHATLNINELERGVVGFRAAR